MTANNGSVNHNPNIGRIVRIAGPVVSATGLDDARLFDVVYVGERRLIGEVIRLEEKTTTMQVYEDTSGLRVGEPAVSSGAPLRATLGPGLLGQVFDGLQRPLAGSRAAAFLEIGQTAPPLDPERRWPFCATAAAGDAVTPGALLGTVAETSGIVHQVMAPPDVAGVVSAIYPGARRSDDVVAIINTAEGDRPVHLSQRWPVRRARPCRRRVDPTTPLLTGTRVIDAFFPVAKGGTAIIPGGFGTGKTVCEQSLARWAAIDVVVYIGCGERGNEMAEVLTEFPTLSDPRHDRPLLERTILIANTSNMPVAAREASIYTGLTMAEYYRDMGYDVLVLADSTSRWGEALREISGRLEEMPGEEGYPAYLATRLAEFYERAGQVECLGPPDRRGSVTVVGAVSPPGGDFSEPMTQNSLRVAGTFWALDYDLSRRRHFPAINWTQSYSLYQLADWFAGALGADWPDLVQAAMTIFQQEADLQAIVQLMGPESLAEEQKAVLASARLLREDFLQQSALDEVDRYCPLEKTGRMLRAILAFDRALQAGVSRGQPLADLLDQPVVAAIGRMKRLAPDSPALAALVNLPPSGGD